MEPPRDAGTCCGVPSKHVVDIDHKEPLARDVHRVFDGCSLQAPAPHAPCLGLLQVVQLGLLGGPWEAQAGCV